MAFKAEFKPQDPLKVKLSIKFQDVDFMSFEKSSAKNFLRMQSKRAGFFLKIIGRNYW